MWTHVKYPTADSEIRQWGVRCCIFIGPAPGHAIVSKRSPSKLGSVTTEVGYLSNGLELASTQEMDLGGLALRHTDTDRIIATITPV